jgi:hypothetical protein
MIGLAPDPYAPTVHGPFLSRYALVMEVNVSPLWKRSLLLVARYVLTAVSKELVVTVCAPLGQPVKSPAVEKQIVFVPEKIVSGSVTTISCVVLVVVTPSKTERVTV